MTATLTRARASALLIGLGILAASPAVAAPAPPAQHRALPGRRPRLWRAWLLRQPRGRHAQPRPVRRRGAAAHRLRFGLERLLPSRSSLLTGRTSYRNGVFTWSPEGSPIHLRAAEIALPRLLREAGYTTCHVGKWHLNCKFNSPEQPQPDAHGYAWWLGTQNNAARSHAFPWNFIRNGEPVGKADDHSAPFIAREAAESPRGREPMASSSSRRLSSCTGSPISCRRRGSTGIAITARSEWRWST